MASLKTAPGSFKKFRMGAPKPVSVPRQELVRTEFLDDAGPMPLVIRPNLEDVDLVAWAGCEREFVERKLQEHGALLFRAFNVTSVSEFEQFAEALCPGLFGDYGDLPDEKEGKKVYKSTPYPPDKTILFHNESSHMNRWPRKQWFFSVKVAQERGETPIVDCRKVYSRLAPEIRDRFERLGLEYVRNFVDGLDVSWREFFGSDDKSQVEDHCRRTFSGFEWIANDGLRIRQRCPAVIQHPKTGEKVFFNQIQLHHVSFLDKDVRSALLSSYGEENLPRNVYYGDGSRIEDTVAEEVLKLYWETAVQFPWQAGDIVMVDNMLVAHARNPYVGERKIVVAMGEMVDREELS